MILTWAEVTLVISRAQEGNVRIYRALTDGVGSTISMAINGTAVHYNKHNITVSLLVTVNKDSS